MDLSPTQFQDMSVLTGLDILLRIIYALGVITSSELKRIATVLTILTALPLALVSSYCGFTHNIELWSLICSHWIKDAIFGSITGSIIKGIIGIFSKRQ